MNNLGSGYVLAATLIAALAGPMTAVAEPKSEEPPKDADVPKADLEKSADKPDPSFRAAVRAMVEQEVLKTGLPADIADAVIDIESSYDPSAIGRVGEIGLMQVRLGTAAMLGFKGSAEELAKPSTNIHYGVAYLSEAWRLANGDLCRTLMKYRAGHGEEVMTSRSVEYCNRARNHLAALGSSFATGGQTPSIVPNSVLANSRSLISSKDVYAQYRQGTPAASRAFWAAHEARIRAIKARIESRWHRLASG
jgi:hypothetical protein